MKTIYPVKQTLMLPKQCRSKEERAGNLTIMPVNTGRSVPSVSDSSPTNSTGGGSGAHLTSVFSGLENQALLVSASADEFLVQVSE